jgi:hypothetical protein
MNDLDKRTLRKIRWALAFFIAGLMLSGATAFPLQLELNWLVEMRGLNGDNNPNNAFDQWLLTVRNGLSDTYTRYPWIGYGTDWLAFAHLIIALFFIGPFIDPVKNIWVVYAGLAACILVPVLALICGPIRHIPFGWRLIDCAFGVIGAIPLLYALKLTKALMNPRI